MIIKQEMAQTMLMYSKLTYIFWTHAVHTTIDIQNRLMLRKNNDKNSYELWKGSTKKTSTSRHKFAKGYAE
jgi:hypothetical protein